MANKLTVPTEVPTIDPDTNRYIQPHDPRKSQGGSGSPSSSGSSGSSGASGSPNYSIDYNDERFVEVESDKQQALADVENTYGGMISETDKYYQAQIDASKDWANTQQQLQQERTDFTIEQIEQQKEQANKDYTKEQAGAYVDWQKQSNKYGVNAEQMASNGLTNTGFSESSQVSMYNTYQNRVAIARESYNNAVLNYNNAIKDAQLQNNSALAEIAYKSLQQQLELSLEGFQYKNQLVTEQLNKKMEVDNTYYNRYQDVLNQMNTENALAEEIRQYNENMQFQKEQLKEEIRQFEQSYALQVKQYEESIRQFNAEMERLKAKDAQEYALEIQRLELQKQQMEQQKREAEREYQLRLQQLQEQQKQFDKEYELKQKQYNAQQKQYDREYKLKKDGETSVDVPTFSSYESASAYMKEQGVATGDGGLMTKSEWSRRKGSGSKSAEVAYSSYAEYLNAFVDWRMSNPQ